MQNAKKLSLKAEFLDQGDSPTTVVFKCEWQDYSSMVEHLTANVSGMLIVQKRYNETGFLRMETRELYFLVHTLEHCTGLMKSSHLALLIML